MYVKRQPLVELYLDKLQSHILVLIYGFNKICLLQSTINISLARAFTDPRPAVCHIYLYELLQPPQLTDDSYWMIVWKNWKIKISTDCEMRVAWGVILSASSPPSLLCLFFNDYRICSCDIVLTWHNDDTNNISDLQFVYFSVLLTYLLTTCHPRHRRKSPIWLWGGGPL